MFSFNSEGSESNTEGTDCVIDLRLAEMACRFERPLCEVWDAGMPEMRTETACPELRANMFVGVVQSERLNGGCFVVCWLFSFLNSLNENDIVKKKESGELLLSKRKATERKKCFF